MTTSTSLSLEESNLRLPLVRLIARDAIKSSRTLASYQQELDELSSIAPKTNNPMDAEASNDVAHIHMLNQLQETIQTEEATLERCRTELNQVGAQLVDASTGLVEFPSTLDGRQISLSWQYDEPEVTHFRTADDDCRTRHPLQPSHQI